MVWSFFIEHVIGRHAQLTLHGHLLQHTLEVGLVPASIGSADPVFHVTQNECLGWFQPSIEVQRAHHRLVHTGQHRLGQLTPANHAFAQNHKLAKSHSSRHDRAGRSADHRAFDFGHLTFFHGTKGAVQVVHHHHAQDGIAEEFHPFARVQSLIGAGRMPQRLVENLGMLKGVAECFLGPFEPFRVVHQDSLLVWGAANGSEGPPDEGKTYGSGRRSRLLVELCHP